ncbi:MAG: putative baseplate assembly protein [Tumebacillaceae bacterium]
MLPLPNLDDRFFEDIVKDARRIIPQLLPQWTDENAHDPGITFIELFSWLTEMQQYYLNRVTAQNELAFLKLLGIRLKQATSARADVTFSHVEQTALLPRGTRLLAKDQLFETETSFWLLPAKIERVIVNAEGESFDFTSSNENVKAGYFAFGASPRKGNRLMLAFDSALPVGQPISLTVNLFDNYTVPLPMPEQGKLDIIPSARISCQYFGVSADDPKATPNWQHLPILEDETVQLSDSGRVTFQLPAEMTAAVMHPANDKRRYWISCQVEEGGYEIPPKIEKISLNTISAVQRDTWSQCVEFDSIDKPHQTFEIDHALARYGKINVQVRESEHGDWAYWDEVPDVKNSAFDSLSYQLSRQEATNHLLLMFGDGEQGRIPTVGQDTIRVVLHTAEFEKDRFLGRSNGLPNQRFELRSSPILLNGLHLQVGVPIPGSKQVLWEDWTRVDDFEHSKATDRHYVFHAETGEFEFGNNERGAIPEVADFPNICLIGLQLGGGERGNVKPHLIEEMVDPPSEFRHLKVTNYFFAKGGREAETLEEAKQRARKDLKRPYRAIGADDYEVIARRTPGLRVARVKAIPLYTTGLHGYPQQKAPAQVTVVVVPYSDSNKPMPSQGFLDTVKKHVNKHRLLTTELHIIPPEYVKITVHALVVVDPIYRDQASKIVNALNRFLRPLDPANAEKGWEFGRTVYKGDIYGMINQLPGVEYIQDLWFDADGNGIQKDSSGDIALPPHGLVYSGDHQIELVSITDV